jgi:hypothetical protein
LNQTFKIKGELFDNFRVSWLDNIMGLSPKNEHFLFFILQSAIFFLFFRLELFWDPSAGNICPANKI